MKYAVKQYPGKGGATVPVKGFEEPMQGPKGLGGKQQTSGKTKHYGKGM